MRTLIILLATILELTASFDLRGGETVKNNMRIDSRITNGVTATDGQFPYQVGLQLFVGYGYSWCGGSLISTRWVLTAAHCAVDVIYANVYLGATSRSEPKVKYKVSSENFIVHSGYNLDNNLINDIALIKIPAVTLSERIQTIKLPSRFGRSKYVGEYAIASGWGWTSDQYREAPEDLQWARLKVIDNDECSEDYYGSVASSVLCAHGPNGVSTCQGDSGGPLVSESDDVLIGLTSYGYIFGCEKGYPTGFTRISSYMDWIYSHTRILD